MEEHVESFQFVPFIQATVSLIFILNNTLIPRIKLPNELKDLRDYEIYKELKEIYKLEWNRTDKLDEKAIELVKSTGVIMALYLGLGTFILETISASKIYFPLLAMILIFGLTLFVIALLFGLSGFDLRSYKATDPSSFIDEYKEKEWIELIHFYGGDIRNATLENRKINDQKVHQTKLSLLFLFGGTVTVLFYAIVVLFALNSIA